jgi:hypothetical protein
MTWGGAAATSASRMKQKVPPTFLLPAYDLAAIAMLGFGILAVLSVPFIF